MPLTNSDTFWFALKQNVVTLIQTLNLAGTVPGFNIGTNVFQQMLPAPLSDNQPTPCVLVTHVEGSEEVAESSTGATEWWYPIRLWICDRDTVRNTAKEQDYLAWRFAIWQALHWKRLAIASADNQATWTTWCEVRMERVLDGDREKFEFVVSRLQPRFRVGFAR